METDSNGFIYRRNIEANSIIFFNPANWTVNIFARDPRIHPLRGYTRLSLFYSEPALADTDVLSRDGQEG